MLKQSRKIYLADTDATGFVYYARYLEWMEAMRLDLLEATGTSLEELKEAGIGAVVKDVTVTFQAPIKLGNTVMTEMGIKSLSRTSIVFFYIFTNLTTNKKAGSGEVVIVFIDLSRMRPTSIPEFVNAALQKALT